MAVLRADPPLPLDANRGCGGSGKKCSHTIVYAPLFCHFAPCPEPRSTFLREVLIIRNDNHGIDFSKPISWVL